MIFRAGTLALQAPDEIPEAAKPLLAAASQQARFGLGLPPDVHDALEDVAFGPEVAAELRRAGTVTRAVALRQLLRGWGEDRVQLSPLARGSR